jgi:hypothetical protein
VASGRISEDTQKPANPKNPFASKTMLADSIVDFCMAFHMNPNQVGELTEVQFVAMMSRLYTAQENLVTNTLVRGALTVK